MIQWCLRAGRGRRYDCSAAGSCSRCRNAETVSSPAGGRRWV